MTRVLLLFITLAFSIVFLFYRPEGDIGFLFSDVKLHADTWVYFLFEHLILVILAYVIYDIEPRYRVSATVFLFIQIADTVDYCLTYGEPWAENLPSWNILKVVIFGLAIAVEFQKHRR